MRCSLHPAKTPCRVPTSTKRAGRNAGAEWCARHPSVLSLAQLDVTDVHAASCSRSQHSDRTCTQHSMPFSISVAHSPNECFNAVCGAVRVCVANVLSCSCDMHQGDHSNAEHLHGSHVCNANTTEKSWQKVVNSFAGFVIIARQQKALHSSLCYSTTCATQQDTQPMRYRLARFARLQLPSNI